MPDLFDYLAWRGDLPLAQVPFGAVDALALTTLAYLQFDGLLDADATLQDAASAYFALDETQRHARRRVEKDEQLLRAMADSDRFGTLPVRLCCGRLDAAAESQFGAMTVLLPKGLMVAFRGTDNTLIGWKEDFNLGFLDTIPAQWAARDYLEQAAAQFSGPVYVGGHSKGGNLAVFAAAGAKCRRRIRTVYNHDGPGFSRALFETAQFRAIAPKVESYVPESSVVGMLLAHEEDYTVVRSSQHGILQHDPYSWQIQGGDFIRAETVSDGSRLISSTLRQWLSELSAAEREQFVEDLFAALTDANAENLEDFTDLKTVTAVLQNLLRTTRDSGVVRDALGRLGRAGWRAAAALLREKEGQE